MGSVILEAKTKTMCYYYISLSELFFGADSHQVPKRIQRGTESGSNVVYQS